MSAQRDTNRALEAFRHIAKSKEYIRMCLRFTLRFYFYLIYDFLYVCSKPNLNPNSNPTIACELKYRQSWGHYLDQLEYTAPMRFDFCGTCLVTSL